jgi:hypothetical protein
VNKFEISRSNKRLASGAAKRRACGLGRCAWTMDAKSSNGYREAQCLKFVRVAGGVPEDINFA